MTNLTAQTAPVFMRKPIPTSELPMLMKRVVLHTFSLGLVHSYSNSFLIALYPFLS